MIGRHAAGAMMADRHWGLPGGVRRQGRRGLAGIVTRSAEPGNQPPSSRCASARAPNTPERSLSPGGTMYWSMCAQDRRRLHVLVQQLLHLAPDQRKQRLVLHHAAAQDDPLGRDRANHVHQRQSQVVGLEWPGRMIGRQGIARLLPTIADRRAAGQSFQAVAVKRAVARIGIGRAGRGECACGPSRDGSARASSCRRPARRRQCRCRSSNRSGRWCPRRRPIAIRPALPRSRRCQNQPARPVRGRPRRQSRFVSSRASGVEVM